MNMKKLITSFLLQSENCTLPHLGTFYRQWVPSQLDIANKQILPPINEISFKETSDTDPGNLVNYIARKKNILVQEARDELNDYCTRWNEKMNAGEKLHLGAVGTLLKNPDGHIYLDRNVLDNYRQPVSAERVLHQNATHNMLVGDRETTSTAMSQYYDGTVVFERSHWGTWAIILIAIAASVLFFHFKDHSISTEGVGNQKHLIVADPPATHAPLQK